VSESVQEHVRLSRIKQVDAMYPENVILKNNIVKECLKMSD
jgi:hypothetical protein